MSSVSSGYNASPAKAGAQTVNKYAWPVLLVVLVAAIAFGTFAGGNSAPPTQQERVNKLASQIRCPTCSGLSVQESESPLAASSKQEIISEVAAGRTDAQIKDYFISRYGATALVTPPKSGFNWTAWIVPAVVAVLLIAGVILSVRKWGQGKKSNRPSDEDRRRVEAALGK